MTAVSPHELNRTLRTLREAAALPLRVLLDPYGYDLDMAASRSCVFAWSEVLKPYGRFRLDPPEVLLAQRLKQARRLLPPQRWQHYAEKFEREVAA